MSLRSWIYRGLNAGFVEKCVLPVVLSEVHLQELKHRRDDLMKLAPPASGVRRIWFHASSFGELESLWSVVELASRRGYELVLTVFSGSARGQLERLRGEVERASGGGVIYAGYSPWEGRWGAALRAVRPSVFVTAKYEAWPELWMSLQEHGVPLVVVGARARSSLVIAKRVCRLLGGALPRMTLLTARYMDVAALEKLLPAARVETAGEPRWDRVFARTKAGSQRARELVESMAHLPRPWGVLGSAWLEDLKEWGDALARAPGTLWLVPHRVERESVELMRAFVEERGLSAKLTSRRDVGVGATPKCVFVDEMGFLSELYAAADWAFVGGGFGSGVHSTIEPAIHGIPLACGPKGAEKFPEVAELVETGQLTVVDGVKAIGAWMDGLVAGGCGGDVARARWRREAGERLGAADRVFALIEGAI
jgi:3-deoxy-D-manno-octulosonic-acid transferase